jgi:hypothetical protein
MRKRVTRVALTLVVLASMSMTLGAGMRWAALSRIAAPSIVGGPSTLVTSAGDVTVPDVAAENADVAAENADPADE